MSEDASVLFANDAFYNAFASSDMQAMEEIEARHLPIVDGEELIGVLSNRDLFGATGWLPQSCRVNESPGQAKDLLRKRPIHCSPDDSVVMVAVDLSSRVIGCLPVLEEGKLVGTLCSPGVPVHNRTSHEHGFTRVHRQTM